MIIAVASGKGGTGKTTVAVNLALSLNNAQLLDCDVEEPNAHIFLKPEIYRREPVDIKIPRIDEDLCNRCGRCAEFCQYNALAVTEKLLMFFPELCHSCGGCMLVCPQKAITETTRTTGMIEYGRRDGIEFVHGILDIGEVMASPLIKEVKDKIKAEEGREVLIDAPPGTSCAVIESVKECDYCILVTEPTPFGLYDLKLAVELLRKIGIPHGVVINQEGIGDDGVHRYCKKEGIEILMKIPYDKRIAELYSEGVPFIEEMDGYREKFREMLAKIKRGVGA